MTDEVGPRRRPVAGHDVDRSGREADARRELGESNRGERSLGIGLEDDGAARRECRCELPGRHHQGVVPGHDLRGDAHRLLQRVEEQRAADRVRAAADRRDGRTVVAEVLDGLLELGLDRRDGLPHVAGLELGKLRAVRGDRVGEGVQKAGTRGPRRLAPLALERPPCRLDRTVDVRFARDRGPRQQLAGGGLADLAHVARRGLDHLAADEQPVLANGRDCHGSESTPRPQPGGQARS